MPFIFRCSQCGSMLCEDPKPELDIGSYKRQTYLERILTELGGNCPFCSHRLQIPPIEIEVSALKRENSGLRRLRK